MSEPRAGVAGKAAVCSLPRGYQIDGVGVLATLSGGSSFPDMAGVRGRS